MFLGLTFCFVAKLSAYSDAPFESSQKASQSNLLSELTRFFI